ncbi:MAG: hypothetical protein ACO1NW_18085 [Chitinophagaceae bacterium]
MKRIFFITCLAAGLSSQKASACEAKPGVPPLDEQHKTATVPASTEQAKTDSCPDKKEVKKKTGKEAILPKKTAVKEEEGSEFRFHPFSRMERS